jgi:heat shock protein HslJ
MNKKMLATGALVVGAAQLVGCGSEDDPLKIFQQNAPADTIMYFQGKHIPGASGFYDLDKIQTTLYRVILAGDASDPEMQSMRKVVDKLLGSQTTVTLDSFGMKDGYAQAIYLDGIAPVVQFEVEDKEKFIASIKELISGVNDLTVKEENLGGKTIQVVELISEEEKEGKKGPSHLFLAASVEEGIATISFYTEKDSDETKQQRLALMKESNPLSDTDRIENLEKKYQVTENTVGFLDLVQLTTSIVKPETTKAGQDFIALNGADDFERLPAECADEFISLSNHVPQFVVGYNTVEVKGQSLFVDTSMILEITNSGVLADLKKLNGHLMPSSMTSEESIFSVSYGFDMDNLVPVATSLLNKFTSASFSCPMLQMAQMQAKEQNPAQLALATTFAAGVKGFAIDLYDVGFEGGQPSSADFSVRVASTQPQNLVNLAGMSGTPISLPDDGTAADLPIPPQAGLPPSFKLKGAIKGESVVVFSGEKAAKNVESEGKLSLNKDGLVSGKVDYNKLFGVASTAIETIGKFNGSDSYECAQMREMVMMWDTAVDYVNFKTGFNDDGMFMKSAGQMTKRERAPFKPGKYDVQLLSDGCEWDLIGQEELKEDGTGAYNSLSEDKSCNAYEGQFHWTKTGSLIEYKEDVLKTREMCSDELSESETSNYSCLILSSNDKGFECLYGVESGDTSIYRYIRK